MPELDPISIMLAELNKRLAAVPFAPFVIVTSSGKSYEAPTPDHLTITRLSRKVIHERDDYATADINPLHITAIEPMSPAGA